MARRQMKLKASTHQAWSVPFMFPVVAPRSAHDNLPLTTPSEFPQEYGRYGALWYRCSNTTLEACYRQSTYSLLSSSLVEPSSHKAGFPQTARRHDVWIRSKGRCAHFSFLQQTANYILKHLIEISRAEKCILRYAIGPAGRRINGDGCHVLEEPLKDT